MLSDLAGVSNNRLSDKGDYPSSFSFTIDTSKGSGGAANQFFLPISNDTYISPIYVDWGDGSAEEEITSGAYPSHQYASAGTYTVTIRQESTRKIPYLFWYGVNADIYNRSNRMLISIDTPLMRMYDGSTLRLQISFASCFRSCVNLVTIHSDLFKYNTQVIAFAQCFDGCTNLSSIPADLFRYNTQAIAFNYCFRSCNGLTEIPTDLFRYNTRVINMIHCFASCINLETIPTDLFRYNTQVLYFGDCFSGCSSITTLPTDLFRYNTQVESFNECFDGCTNLSSIPVDLFKYNTQVTLFTECFRYCSSLTTLPTDLFRYNTQVTAFNYCFDGCTNLSSIPADLFRYNTQVTAFNYCFRNCSNLTTTINPTLGNFFAPSLPTSGMNVNRMFYNCSSSTGNATDFVDLFDSRCAGDAEKYGALYNCTSWTAYGDIDAIWKSV